MNIIFTTNQLLEDATVNLDKISNTTYCTKIPLLLNASIGQHTRHYIELYQCLLGREEKKQVNYENRPRNKVLETDITAAQEAIQVIQNELSQIDIPAKMFLHSSLTDSEKVLSCMERELIYNYEHCLHHLAIIRIGLGIIQPDLEIPAHFGIAPSTLAYQQKSIPS